MFVPKYNTIKREDLDQIFTMIEKCGYIWVTTQDEKGNELLKIFDSDLMGYEILTFRIIP